MKAAPLASAGTYGVTGYGRRRRGTDTCVERCGAVYRLPRGCRLRLNAIFAAATTACTSKIQIDAAHNIGKNRSGGVADGAAGIRDGLRFMDAKISVARLWMRKTKVVALATALA